MGWTFSFAFSSFLESQTEGKKDKDFQTQRNDFQFRMQHKKSAVKVNTAQHQALVYKTIRVFAD